VGLVYEAMQLYELITLLKIIRTTSFPTSCTR